MDTYKLDVEEISTEEQKDLRKRGKLIDVLRPSMPSGSHAPSIDARDLYRLEWENAAQMDKALDTYESDMEEVKMEEQADASEQGQLADVLRPSMPSGSHAPSVDASDLDSSAGAIHAPSTTGSTSSHASLVHQSEPVTANTAGCTTVP